MFVSNVFFVLFCFFLVCLCVFGAALLVGVRNGGVRSVSVMDWNGDLSMSVCSTLCCFVLLFFADAEQCSEWAQGSWRKKGACPKKVS